MIEPDATHFRVGDKWRSPMGSIYKVVKRTGQKVTLIPERPQRPLWSPRKIWRSWDAIGANSAWPWIRISWGGEQ